MTFVAVAIVGASITVAGATAKTIDGAVKAKKAKTAAETAQIELDKQKSNFANLDTSNPYLNLENTMEDLTVDKKQAEFQKQQSMQSQANIMEQMRGAAGGSGIGALAQTLANQGSLDAQKASASIGQQEAQNQKMERAEASRIQGKEREGDLISRQAVHGKTTGLMGMAADEVSTAKAERAAAQQQMYDGISEVGGAVSGVASGGIGGGVGGGGATPSQIPIDPSTGQPATEIGGFLDGMNNYPNP
jgi:hypothetical protein